MSRLWNKEMIKMEENQVACVECQSTDMIEYCVECGNPFCNEHIHNVLSIEPNSIFACEDCIRVVIQKAGIHIKRQDGDS